MTVSNINVQEHTYSNFYHDTIGIYDSGRTPKISAAVTNSVHSFFKCSSDSLRFDIINLLAQPNAYDCGIYAIAYATELAYGSDPAKCLWNSEAMRLHLLTCLENNKLTRFPTIGARKIRLGSRVRKSVLFNIYCVCNF